MAILKAIRFDALGADHFYLTNPLLIFYAREGYNTGETIRVRMG
jgi:hypothetical protein